MSGHETLKTKHDAPKPKIKLGFYAHFKTREVYEVIALVKNCNNMPDDYCGWNVVYRNVKNRMMFSRDAVEFVEPLGPSGQVRFEFMNELDTPLQLFATTLRMCRLEYLRNATENPLYIQNRANIPFKYMVGDKISLAQSLRLINTKQANVLINWLNAWTAEPSTSNERKRIFEFGKEAEALKDGLKRVN